MHFVPDASMFVITHELDTNIGHGVRLPYKETFQSNLKIDRYELNQITEHAANITVATSWRFS